MASRNLRARARWQLRLFALVVFSVAAIDSGSPHIVRIVAARCIWPSITHDQARVQQRHVQNLCKIRESALSRQAPSARPSPQAFLVLPRYSRLCDTAHHLYLVQQ